MLNERVVTKRFYVLECVGPPRIKSREETVVESIKTRARGKGKDGVDAELVGWGQKNNKLEGKEKESRA